MRKKDIVFYTLTVVLVMVIMWQYLSSSTSSKELFEQNAFRKQLQFLLGIGDLNSAHQHADVKVYLNGEAVDFSKQKYQLTSNFLHFEEGIGDVIHTHASGITAGHLIRAVGGTLSHECISFEGKQYCTDSQNSLKFYVNGQKNDLHDNYVIEDLDKILISYGPKNENIQPQLASITDLARVYSKK